MFILFIRVLTFSVLSKRILDIKIIIFTNTGENNNKNNRFRVGVKNNLIAGKT